MVKITPKQRRIVKAHAKGVKNKDIGLVEYPMANSNSQAVLVSRELKKPNVAQYSEQMKLIALKENNITWTRIAKVINEALDADKMNQFTGEITPDYTIRLSANKQAQNLLEAKQINDEFKEQLQRLPIGADTIELVRLFKSK